MRLTGRALTCSSLPRLPDNTPDDYWFLSRGAEQRLGTGRSIDRNDSNEADPKVKRAPHIGLRNTAQLLNQSEYGRTLPRIPLDIDLQSIG